MSAKGKGKGKGKGKKKEEDPNKLSNVDKAFCELTIADLNRKLSGLRSHLATLDETNVNLTEKLRELEEDRVDVAAHLERVLIERNDKILELEERLEEISKVREEEAQASGEMIKNLEAKYKAMHDQLTSEIKLLNGKLNSLDEFRIQRDVMMAKFEDQDLELKEKDRAHKEIIHEMEQKQIVERDALKKEVETKLLQVSEDFMRSSEIRNAGYTRRLIRENIALQKEIDMLVMEQIKMTQQLKDEADGHKQMIEEYNALGEIRNELIASGQHKIIIIENLTQQYENIKVKYVEAMKYRGLYEKLVSRDVCERFLMKDMEKKTRTLIEEIELLHREKKKMAALHTTHEIEILRLRKSMQSVKNALQRAVAEVEVKEMISAEPGLEHVELAEDLGAGRRTLLAELINIISTFGDEFPKTPSISTVSTITEPVYRTGKLGFMQTSKTSLIEMGAFRQRKTADDESQGPEFVLKSQESKIIPKERHVDNMIVDVEMGSMLVASSSHEVIDMVPQEEQEALQEEEAESSDMSSSMSTQTVATEAKRATSIHPVSKHDLRRTTKRMEPAEIESSHPDKIDDDEEVEEEDTAYFFY